MQPYPDIFFFHFLCFASCSFATQHVLSHILHASSWTFLLFTYFSLPTATLSVAFEFNVSAVITFFQLSSNVCMCVAPLFAWLEIVTRISWTLLILQRSRLLFHSQFSGDTLNYSVLLWPLLFDAWHFAHLLHRNAILVKCSEVAKITDFEFVPVEVGRWAVAALKAAKALYLLLCKWNPKLFLILTIFHANTMTLKKKE